MLDSSIWHFLPLSAWNRSIILVETSPKFHLENMICNVMYDLMLICQRAFSDEWERELQFCRDRGRCRLFSHCNLLIWRGILISVATYLIKRDNGPALNLVVTTKISSRLLQWWYFYVRVGQLYSIVCLLSIFHYLHVHMHIYTQQGQNERHQYSKVTVI